MRTAALLLMLLTAAEVPAVRAQQQNPPRPPREPRTSPREYPAGDASRLGTRLRSGEVAAAMALEQPECPLTLHALSMRHDDAGSTLTLRVGNDGKASVTRYTITAWVMMADGTPKGAERWLQKTTLGPGEGRPLSLTLRTVRVSPSDAVVLAVLETQGDAWKGDEKVLERQARAVALR